MRMKIYGIPNCDTVKKARLWLKNHDLQYEFHDFKKDGVTLDRLQTWAEQVGWEKLLKKRGPTWGKLPDEVKQSANNQATVLNLMLEKPNLIKRPVLEQDGQVLLLGFDDAKYQSLLGKYLGKIS
jgi:arsenate reductase